jgi:hypothetical protein
VGVDHAAVGEQRAYLVRIATRQALDRLRHLSRRKESYIGPWLPEPLLTAPDVVALSDGGGVRHALLHPVVGADRVARLLAAGWWRRDAERTVEQVQVNGAPGLLVRIDGQIDGVVAVQVEHGLVTGAYHVRNPEKLTHMASETDVRR